MTGCSLSMLPLHNLDFSQLYSPNLQFDDFTFPGSLTLPLTQNVVCTYSDTHTKYSTYISTIYFVLQPSQQWRKGIARHQPLESKGLWPLSIVVGGRDRLSAGKAQSKQCIAAAVCEERFPGANTHLKNTSVSPSFFLSPSHF